MMRAFSCGRWPAALMLMAAAGCGVYAPAATGRPLSSGAHPRVWFESLQMVSPRAGWALVATSNPTAGNGAPVAAARTADGGRTWTAVGPAAVGRLAGEPIALQATTASRAWLAVDVRVGPARHVTEVFGTQNGGASWRQTAPVYVYDPISVDFLDPAHGWLLENLGAAMNNNWVAVYRTTDSGRRWSLTARTVQSDIFGTTSRSGLPTACDKSGLIFSSLRTGWITGGCNAGSEVLVTHDAGYHWAPQRLPITYAACSGGGCFIPPPQFIGQTGFLTIGRYPATGELLVTTDGGAVWQLRQLPAGAGPDPQIRFFTAGRGIAVSNRTQGTGRDFYVTADGGRNWTAVRQGRRFGQAGTYVDFVNTSDGFAWISSGSIDSGPAPDMYVTTNSGRTWTTIAPRQAAQREA